MVAEVNLTALLHSFPTTTTMPICTSCTEPASYLYTVYGSQYNLRLEQCVCLLCITLLVRVVTRLQAAILSRIRRSLR